MRGSEEASSRNQASKQASERARERASERASKQTHTIWFHRTQGPRKWAQQSANTFLQALSAKQTNSYGFLFQLLSPRDNIITYALKRFWAQSLVAKQHKQTPKRTGVAKHQGVLLAEIHKRSTAYFSTIWQALFSYNVLPRYLFQGIIIHEATVSALIIDGGPWHCNASLCTPSEIETNQSGLC